MTLKYAIQTYIYDEWNDYATFITWSEEEARSIFGDYEQHAPDLPMRLVKIVRSDEIIIERPMFWEDASTNRYSAESLKMGNLRVSVCSDDEGLLRPAFYWWISRNGVKVLGGWSPTVDKAKADSVECVPQFL